MVEEVTLGLRDKDNTLTALGGQQPSETITKAVEKKLIHF
jgi:hypothetical protein